MKGLKTPSGTKAPTHDFLFRESLEELDGDTDVLSRWEEDRQADQIILIASESIAPRAVREAMSTVFANVYAEGYPSNRLSKREAKKLEDYERYLAFHRRYGDRRFYKGTEYSDFIEVLAQRRAAEAFATKDMPAEKLFVNVQPLSGAAANNAVYEAFLQPGDPVVGLNLSHGGHLTHGSPANRSGKRYKVTPYHVNLETGRLDYDEIMRVVKEARPKLLIAGASAYPYDWDWKKMRAAADEVGAILLADISHPAGLISAGVLSSPIGYADVVSMTTHKTLCGPRGAILITSDAAHARAIDAAVFPGEQGGPHLNQIAAKAVCFGIAKTQKFKDCMKQVAANAKALLAELVKHGLTIANGGGTDSHLFTIDLKSLETPTGKPLAGDAAANILDLCGITLNKNTLPGDTNAAHPSGLRIGTVFITQRGLTEAHMGTLASLIARVLKESEPYVIEGGAGGVGRAKIPVDTLQQVREGVRRLAHEARWDTGTRATRFLLDRLESPLTASHKEAKAVLEDRHGHLVAVHFGDASAERAAFDRGAALCDLSDRPLLSIRGERARSFVSNAVASASLLNPGEATSSVLLNPDGETIDEPGLMRMASGKDGFDEFWMFDADARTRGWLEALSDGYVRFDGKDLFGKVDGPVVVEDIRHARQSERRRIAMALAGPKAPGVLSALGTPFGTVGAGRWVEGTVEGAPVIVARPGASNWFAVIVSPNDAAKVWGRLRRDGATPAGASARESSRRDTVKPDVRKPYYIGCRKAAPAPATKETFTWKEPEGLPLKKSCLYDEHLKLTKKRYMVPFAGWEMPVLYTSILDEHQAVRTRAGMFDITHMGTIDVSGPNAQRFIELVTTNFVPRLRDGQTQYSYVLGPDGKVMDDILVYRRAWDRFLLVVNASNHDKLWAWFSAVAARKVVLDPSRPTVEIEGDVVLRDLKNPSSGADQLVDVAVQGPKSLAILQRASDTKPGKAALRDLKKSEFIETTLCGGIKALVSKTGYTGENTGFEVYLHPDKAPALWQGLLKAGEKYGLMACGLGARDSTRTEAGLPLYGHELAGEFDIIPAEAGYGTFVKRHKTFFVGRDAVIAREETMKNEVVRFHLNSEKARAIRPHDPVVNPKGQFIGRVTSCTLVGKTQIGLAYVDRRFGKEGAQLAIFPLQRHEDRETAIEKPKDKLGVGDKVTLAELATVMDRFPQPRVEAEEEE